MINILITRPCHDDTTAYCHEWSKEIIDFADKKNVKLHDLRKEKANKEELESRVSKFQPKLLIFNGHGSDEEICGHDNKTLVKYGVNEKLLKSRIAYARTCHSAKKLGKKITEENPSTAFIGYEHKFLFPFDASRTATPLKDSFAKSFFESTNIILISLIKGNNVKESSERSQDTFQKNIDFFETQRTLEAPHIAFFLKWDKYFQKAHGNLNASIG